MLANDVPLMLISVVVEWIKDAIHRRRIDWDFGRGGPPNLPIPFAGDVQRPGEDIALIGFNNNCISGKYPHIINTPYFRFDSTYLKSSSRGSAASFSIRPGHRSSSERLSPPSGTGPRCNISTYPRSTRTLSNLYRRSLGGRLNFDWLSRRIACSRALYRRTTSYLQLFPRLLLWSSPISFRLGPWSANFVSVP